MNDPKTLYEERRQRVAKTIRREKVDKPPFMLFADTYVPFYAGVERSSITSYEQASDLMEKFHKDVPFDTASGVFMPPNLCVGPLTDILGGGCFTVKDFIKMQVPETVLIMEQKDYPELIENPAKYLLEVAYKKRFELLRNNNPEEKFNGFMQLMGEYQKLGKYFQDLEANGINIIAGTTLVNPVDYIFDFVRGFEGTVNDIKRCPELVRDAGMAIFEQFKPLIQAAPKAEDKAINIPMHCPTFISPRDFEKVYWPSFKAMADYMVEQGHNVMYYFEKKYEHLFDFLQDLPKKGIVGIFEEDDIRMTKEKLGSTMAIAGGLSTSLMQNGTKEQCIDLVKGLIEDVSSQGGYFIAPTTPMMFSSDGRPENLKAVADYIDNYKF